MMAEFQVGAGRQVPRLQQSLLALFAEVAHQEYGRGAHFKANDDRVVIEGQSGIVGTTHVTRVKDIHPNPRYGQNLHKFSVRTVTPISRAVFRSRS